MGKAFYRKIRNDIFEYLQQFDLTPSEILLFYWILNNCNDESSDSKHWCVTKSGKELSLLFNTTPPKISDRLKTLFSAGLIIKQKKRIIKIKDHERFFVDKDNPQEQVDVEEMRALRPKKEVKEKKEFDICAEIANLDKEVKPIEYVYRGEKS